MRVIEVTKFGGPEVLELHEVAEPEPGPGQLLVEVGVVEIIHLDTKLRSGWGQDFFPMRPPWVPGTGVAGTVTAVGEGVDPARLRERVVASTGNKGAYAERVVVGAEVAYPIPDGLDPAVATAALHDGVLALSYLEHLPVYADDRVLVTGAAGALGYWFVPLARRAGAEVIGAAGGSRKVAAVAEAGADRVVDYSRAGWADEIGGPLDVVFDGVGGEVGRTAVTLLRPGGSLGAYGSSAGDFAGPGTRDDLMVRGLDARPSDAERAAYVRAGLGLLAAGTVRPPIGQRVPLAAAARAHAAIAERRIVGKSVLQV